MLTKIEMWMLIRNLDRQVRRNQISLNQAMEIESDMLSMNSMSDKDMLEFIDAEWNQFQNKLNLEIN